MKQRISFNFLPLDNRAPVRRVLETDPELIKQVDRSPQQQESPMLAPKEAPKEGGKPSGAEEAGAAGIAAGAQLASGLMGAASRKEQINTQLKNKAMRGAEETSSHASKMLGAGQQNALGSLVARWKEAFLNR